MSDIKFNSTWNLSSYVFWNQMKTPIHINDIKTFWQYFNNLKDTNQIGKNNITFFRNGISASWEDPKNRYGFIIGVDFDKNVIASRIKHLIQKTAICMVAEDFPYRKKINGFVMRTRFNGSRFTIWIDSMKTHRGIRRIMEYFISHCLKPSRITGKVFCKNQSDALEMKSCYKSQKILVQEF